jgi:aminoglycoside phosphotransferase (APT) family kinase protein
VTTPVDLATLRTLLPESVLGITTGITPLSVGLSGAGVYAVTSERGEFVLRVQGADTDARAWVRQLRVLRRAAERGIAPAIMHVDEAEFTVISARAGGVPLGAALADPAQRGAAVASVVSQLRALHAVDPTGVDVVDPVEYARPVWTAQKDRLGFPAWVGDLNGVLDSAATRLGRDERRVVSHNDMNPGNVFWDGTRAWLVDWAVAGLTHPYYDLAAFSTFLNMDLDAACGLLGAQEQRSLDADDRATFAALRQLVALAVGCTFLGMVPDLTVLGATDRDSALTLADFYTQMRTGKMDFSTALGRGTYGLAMLRLGTERG